MESSSINGMCRCCASQGAFKDIKSSYNWMGEEEVYSDMLRECFDVNLTSVEQGGICELCITQLRNSSNFKKQVQLTEQQFKDHLRSKGFKPAVKEEVSAFDDNDSDDNDMDNGDDEDYVPEYEVPIKTESDTEKPSKKRGAKALSTRAKKSKSSDGDAVKSLKSVTKREPDDSAWAITITKIENDNKIKKEKDDVESINTDKKVQRLNDVIIKKVKKKKQKSSPSKKLRNSEPEVADLLKMHKIFCGKPTEPVVDQENELNKHRHNIRTIMEHSTATPFRAFHVDEGFACCFCDTFFKVPIDLKIHTNQMHVYDKEKFKEKSTSIFTYVVKLDITDLCCKICNANVKTLEDFIEHLQTHDVNIHTDIKNQIVCFKFDSNVLCCMYCGNEFTNFKFLLDHMNEHYTNYICEDCNAGFINYRMLVAHADGEDLTVGEVKCPLCDEVFEKYTTYKQHEALAHTGFDLTSHECNICKEKFKSDRCLRKHVDDKHEGCHQYRCSVCNKIYNAKSLLIGHVKRAHLQEERNFKCDLCVRSFHTRQLLQKHMWIHSDTRKYQCDICSIKFLHKKTLKRHIYTHQLKGKHKCLLCDESFIRMSHLNHHVRQYHLNDTITKCEMCCKDLYKSQLKKHISLRHSDMRTFKCEVCSEECESKKALVIHMGTHNNFKPKAKKYECRACGKMFDKKIYVQKHTERVHLLEKPFVCDHCGKQFADCTTLKNHLAQHGPGPSFQCFGCSRMFKTKKTMLNHARNHMESKKVKCEICQHSFIYPYLLRDHMKAVHRVQ